MPITETQDITLYCQAWIEPDTSDLDLRALALLDYTSVLADGIQLTLTTPWNAHHPVTLDDVNVYYLSLRAALRLALFNQQRDLADDYGIFYGQFVELLMNGISLEEHVRSIATAYDFA